MAQAEITVATVGPMTGQYAIFGEQMRRGAAYMVEQINKAGGINGEEVRLESATTSATRGRRWRSPTKWRPRAWRP